MSDKKLLFSVTKKDLRLQWFSGTGAGGQYRNKHQNCARLHHPDSGATVTGQSYRERTVNLKEAMSNLVKHPKFRFWHTAKAQAIITGITIEELVDDMMQPHNLQIETRDKDNRWEPEGSQR
ncbi:MAG: peptide chain release factor-like protein [Chloroflexota bacterium]